MGARAEGKLNGLDLFSGIGGLTVALEPWVRPVAYCEINQRAVATLLSRMAGGGIPTAPVWDDVSTLRGEMLPEIDIVYGGFPCQDISVSGTGKGLAGKRSGLFFEIARLVGELRPRFVFLENVPKIIDRGLLGVTREFAEMRYDCRWGVLSSGRMGAPHLRKRWWLLAHPDGERLEGVDQGRQERRPSVHRFLPIEGKAGSHHLSLPLVIPIDERVRGVRRVDDGIPDGLDRLRELGNSVDPRTARDAFARLSGMR